MSQPVKRTQKTNKQQEKLPNIGGKGSAKLETVAIMYGHICCICEKDKISCECLSDKDFVSPRKESLQTPLMVKMAAVLNVHDAQWVALAWKSPKWKCSKLRPA